MSSRTFRSPSSTSTSAERNRSKRIAPSHAIAEADRIVLYEALQGRKLPLYDVDGGQSGWIWAEEARPPAAPLAEAAEGLAPFPLPKLEAAAFQFWSFKRSAREAPTTVSVALQLQGLKVYDRWLDILRRAGVPELDGLPQRADQIKSAEDVHRLMDRLRQAFEKNPRLPERIVSVVGQADDLRPKEKQSILALAPLYGGPGNRYINFYGPPGTIRTIPYQTLVQRDGGTKKAKTFEASDR